MLFDLREIMLMIKDTVNQERDKPFGSHVQWGVMVSDWEEKGCLFSGGWWGQSDFSPIPLDCSSTPVMLFHKI